MHVTVVVCQYWVENVKCSFHDLSHLSENISRVWFYLFFLLLFYFITRTSSNFMCTAFTRKKLFFCVRERKSAISFFLKIVQKFYNRCFGRLLTWTRKNYVRFRWKRFIFEWEKCGMSLHKKKKQIWEWGYFIIGRKSCWF